MARTLELNVRINGQVELLDGDGNQVWTSQGDDDFLEFIDTDFVQEDDLPEVYTYLRDSDVITESELEAFENDTFDVFIEEPDKSHGDVIDADVVDDDDDDGDDDDETDD